MSNSGEIYPSLYKCSVISSTHWKNMLVNQVHPQDKSMAELKLPPEDCMENEKQDDSTINGIKLMYPSPIS